MPRSASRGDRAERLTTQILTNVSSLNGNPYLELWNAAVDRSGAVSSPLTWRSAALSGGDWVHLQWPERALRAAAGRRALVDGLALVAQTALARVGGARVLLTAHNVHSHDPRHPRLDRLLWTVLSPLVTDLHVMTEAGARTFLDAHPRLRGAVRHVVPHGHYGPLVTMTPQAAARSAAGLPVDARILLTFGALRGYKGVDILLAAFASAAGPEDLLVVAGRVHGEALASRLTAAAASDARIILKPEFLPHDELAALIIAADQVVLPYRAVLNSGSVMLALSLNRPVVVPETPTFGEIAEKVGEGWVTLVPDRATTDWLVDARPAGSPDLSWCSWEQVTSLLVDLWGAPRGGAMHRPRRAVQ